MFDLKKTRQRWESELLSDGDADSFNAGVGWATDVASFEEAKRVRSTVQVTRPPFPIGLMVGLAALGIDDLDGEKQSKIKKFWEARHIDLSHYQESVECSGHYYPNDKTATSFCNGVSYVVLQIARESTVVAKKLAD